MTLAGKAPNSPIIGIIGGMGPYAGLDLHKKILDLVKAERDQDYPSVVHLALPSCVGDRTQFLLDGKGENPAVSIFRMVEMLEAMDTRVAAVACNTAHAPEIFDPVLEMIRKKKLRLKLLHMVDEVVRFVREDVRSLHRIGILATMGVYRSRLYDQFMVQAGLEPIVLSPEENQNWVHRAIYDKEFGLKIKNSPPAPASGLLLKKAILKLSHMGAEAVILGCTEIPLGVSALSECGVPLIDPTLVMARALVSKFSNENITCLKHVD